METDSLTFARPGWLAALAMLPLLAALLAWSSRRARARIARVAAPRLLATLARSVSTPRRIARAALALFAAALIIAGMAGPQLGTIERKMTPRGRDIMLAVDVSRSMLATDIAPTRLARTKLFARDLLAQASGDRLGLIAFAGSAFLQAPLTLDRGAVLAAIEELDTELIPKGGTNIAAAIELAFQAFGKGEGESRALVIVSDGEELDGDGVRAAKEAARRGVRIFTVGVGSEEGSLISIRAEDGSQDYVRDPQGRPVLSKLDAARLREIARATGGFFTMLGPDAAREILERGIRPLEAAEGEAFAARQPIDRSAWPLGAACVLLALRALLGERRRLPAAAAALALLAANGASADEGVRAYQSGNFSKAREIFERRLENQPQDARALFNAAAAAYQLGDYEKAVKYYAAALAALNPEKDQTLPADTAYNLANALARRGEHAPRTEDKKADWKDALAHYDAALAARPDDLAARENREIVRKMLEELEKQHQHQQQDDQPPPQEPPQQQCQRQNQGGRDEQRGKQEPPERPPRQEPSGGEREPREQQQQNENHQHPPEKPEGQESLPGEERSQQRPQDEIGQQENQQAAPSSPGGQDQPAGQASPPPLPTPGEKKEGELELAGGAQNQEKVSEAGAAEAEEREGRMSERQARALLNSLRNEEERVQIMRQAEEPPVLRDW